VRSVAFGKYQEWLTEDGLLLLKDFARDGLTDEQIADKCGINVGTLYRWKNEHGEICEALKRGKEPYDAEVVDSLHNKTKGYTVKVEKAFKLREVYYDEKGHRCEKETLETALEDQYIPPDTAAQIFWLCNRRPSAWKNKRESTIDIRKTQEEATDETLALLEEIENEECGEEAGNAPKDS
jgi:transcriptional regulator with XRE-family HTH domain